MPRRSRLLHFFTHVITNILPAASYLQAFCFCIFPKMPLAPSEYPPKPLKGYNRAPENRSAARFLGRGAAGATGKAASTARRLPWRLAGDEAERRFARANPPCLVFIKVHLQGIRRNPASGVPSAERRRQSLLARTLRVLALADIPKKKHRYDLCFFFGAPSGTRTRDPLIKSL